MTHNLEDNDITRWVTQHDNAEDSVILKMQSQCKYYTVSELPEVVDNFSLLQINARSIKNKFDMINTFIGRSGVDWSVICISETWLKQDIVKYFNIDKYNLFASCRSTGEGGGTAIYVNSKLEAKLRPDLQQCTNLETTFVEIKINTMNGQKCIVVGEIYRPPSYPNNDFLESAEILLDVLEAENKCTLLAGDFNYNLLNKNKDKYTEMFCNLMLAYGFQPTIWKPTRCTNDTVAILDNIFINNLSSFLSSGVIVEDISDHFPVFFILATKQKKGKDL